jgi:hypothetical protein
MARHPVFIGDGDKAAPNEEPRDQPPGEEELGGGDICSPEEESSTDDDKPLD